MHVVVVYREPADPAAAGALQGYQECQWSDALVPQVLSEEFDEFRSFFFFASPDRYVYGFGRENVSVLDSYGTKSLGEPATSPLE